MKKPSSTADHKEHQSLLDTTEFKGRSHDGKMKSVNLRNSDGVLGIEQTAKGYQLSSYDNSTDEHLVSEEYLFNNEADARNFLDSHNQAMKSQVVVNTSPSASVDELQRRHEQKIRHAEENERRKHGGTATSPYLDSDNT